MKKNNFKINTFIYFTFLIIFLEIAFKLLVFKNLSIESIFYTIIFTMPISAFFTLLTNLFSEKVNKIIYFVSISIITFLFLFQFIFYKLFSVPFSFHTLGLADQAADFIDIIFEALKTYIIGIIVLIIPLVALIFMKKKTKFKKFDSKQLGLFIGTFIIFVLISYISLFIKKDDLYSPYSLYFKVNNQEKTIDKIGLLTATRLDVKRVIFGFEESIISSNITDIGSEEDENKPIVYGYNEIDLDFTQLKEGKNSNTTKLLEYFEQATPSQKSEYTGMFKDKNLIFILAEGFNSIAVDEALTPTLYKLVNNGFVFENYYSPVFLSTTGGEFQATTGLIPTQDILNRWKDRTPKISYALGNQFNNLRYNVNAYHNWTYTYYQRNKTMKTLGYQNYLGCKNGLEKEMSCRWLPSDVDMMNVTVPKYIDSEKFMTYYISVSGHAPYNMTGGNRIAIKNKALVEDLPYSKPVKSYLSTQIEFDRAIENMISQLEAAGKLDDTVIVITGDHYPYTLTVDEINEVSKYKRDGAVEVNRSNLIIWNNQMQTPIKVDKVGSQIDVLPTVLNLFGIEYDSRLIVGKDILSTYPGLAIFSDRSWVSDKGTYFSKSRKFVPREGESVDEEYIKNMNIEVANRFSVSGQIINNNIYKTILGE